MMIIMAGLESPSPGRVRVASHELIEIIAALIGSLTAWAFITWVMNASWDFMPSVVFTTTLLCTVTTLTIGFVDTWRALGQKAAPLVHNE